MDRKSMGSAVVVGSIWIASLASPAAVQACRLFDCFSCFKRNPTPVTTYAPVVTAPVATPTAVAPAGSCGPAQCEQTVLRYLPQVAYRTVWQPVPVTTYRRTVSTNPTTGLPITCTQPCTTYTYQARRVPYTTFRPVYATEPVTAPVATVPAAAPAVVAPAAVPTVTQPCTNCNATSGLTYAPQTTQPYYSAPSASPPTGVAPSYGVPSSGTPSDVSGATPWEPVTPGQSSQFAPDGTTPSPSDVPPGSTDPADVRPRIGPSIDPNLNGTSSGNSAANHSAAAARGAKEYDNGRDYGYGQSNAAVPAATGWSTVRPEISSPPSYPADGLESRLVPGSREGVANDRRPNYPAVEVAPYRARPLPGAEAPATTSGDESQAPPLLNDPRNRTAVRPIPARRLPQPEVAEPIPTRWASSRIQWPERRAAYTREVVPASEVNRTPVQTPRRLEPQRIRIKRFDSDSYRPAPADQNGWRSARR